MRLPFYKLIAQFLLLLMLDYPALAAGEASDADTSDGKPVENSEPEEEQAPQFVRKTQIAEIPEGELQPWRLLRSIQRAQDEIVRGKKDAIRAYRILLLQSANWMRTLDTSTWQFQKNLDAVAAYLLIGGDVELGYKALRESRLERPYKILLEAAIAYAEQNVREANSLFVFVDHKSLPPSISGQVALAKSMMFSSSDLEKASEFLEEARKLAPGTLVEEAAIRRGIRIAAETEDKEKVRRLNRTYLFRFRNSYYFNDFLRNISYALVNTLDESGSNMIPEFQFLFSKVGNSERIAIAEYAMRRAVISGQHDLVFWLADQVIPDTDEASKAHTRLRLYYLAAKLREKNSTDEVVMALETLPVSHLDERDRKIYEIVTATGHSINLDSAALRSNVGVISEGEEAAANTTSADPLAGQKKRLEMQLSEIKKLTASTIK